MPKVYFEGQKPEWDFWETRAGVCLSWVFFGVFFLGIFVTFHKKGGLGPGFILMAPFLALMAWFIFQQQCPSESKGLGRFLRRAACWVLRSFTCPVIGALCAVLWIGFGAPALSIVSRGPSAALAFYERNGFDAALLAIEWERAHLAETAQFAGITPRRLDPVRTLEPEDLCSRIEEVKKERASGKTVTWNDDRLVQEANRSSR